MKNIISKIICLLIFLFAGDNLFCAVLVDRATPIGENNSRYNYEAITVSFNQQMVNLQTIKEITNQYFSFNIDIKGSYRWLSVNTLAFYPSETLPDNTKIAITLKKGIKSEVSGEVLANDYTWEFNTLRPIRIKSSPYNEQWDVATDVSIVVYYNMPIYLQSAKEKITLMSESEEYFNYNIDFDIRYATTNDLRYWEIDEYDLRQVLVITPKEKFDKNEAVVVHIDSGLAAIDGDLGSAEHYSFHFHTHDNFYLSEKYKEQTVRASYSPEPPKIIFSTRVYWADLIRNIEITPQIQLPSEEDLEDETWSRKDFSLYSLRFNPNIKYSIKIKESLKDIYGQTLGKEETIILNITDYNPRVSIPSGMGIVEAYEGVRFPIEVINPNPITVQSRYVDKNNICLLYTSPSPRDVK